MVYFEHGRKRSSDGALTKIVITDLSQWSQMNITNLLKWTYILFEINGTIFALVIWPPCEEFVRLLVFFFFFMHIVSIPSYNKETLWFYFGCSRQAKILGDMTRCWYERNRQRTVNFELFLNLKSFPNDCPYLSVRQRGHCWQVSALHDWCVCLTKIINQAARGLTFTFMSFLLAK